MVEGDVSFKQRNEIFKILMLYTYILTCFWCFKGVFYTGGKGISFNLKFY